MSKIVLLEDDLPMASLILKFLKATGFSNIHHYKHSDEVPALHHLELPDLFIMDNDAPETGSGQKKIEEIRAKHPDANFVMFTGRNEPDIIAWATERDIRLLKKPDDLAALVQLVQELNTALTAKAIPAQR